MGALTVERIDRPQQGEKLAPSEADLKKKCEDVLAESERWFFNAGVVLWVIREKELYREDYTTFELYCKKQWGMSRSYAWRLIEAALTVRNIANISDDRAIECTLPTGNIIGPDWDQLPNNESMVRPLTKLRPETQKQVWEATLDLANTKGIAPNSKIVTQAVKMITGRTPDPEKHYASSQSVQWYTPDWIWKRAQKFFGGSIGLDPFSNSLYRPNVPALMVLTEEDNGLIQDWKSNSAFVNPPYGDLIEQCVNKGMGQLENCPEQIWLVPSSTGSQWFKYLSQNCCRRLDIEGRVSFLFGGEDEKQAEVAPFWSTIFYFGSNPSGFKLHFSDIGTIWSPDV